MRYDELYEDHSRLWAIQAAYDMTGGYVESGDLELLLRSPNKRTAASCLRRQIEHWFMAGIDGGDARPVPPERVVAEHPEIWDLAEKYGFDNLIPHHQR